MLIQMKPLNWFKVDPNQPRKQFDEAKLRELGESLKVHGPLVPVLAKPDGTLLAGERRLRAAPLGSLTELPTIITDRMLSETEIRLIQLTENMQREDLSAYEQWRACAELMSLNPAWQMKDLAGQLKKDPSSLTRILSPSKCSTAWQEALKEGKAGISDCYAASKLPENAQAELLALKLSGASRDAIEQAGRKKRNGSAPGAKVSRLKVPLASGASVQVSGPGITLDDAIEATQAALKAMKKARDDGLDSKTAQAVFRDKSKKGGGSP
ncbi:MAG TPA: ParB/RepB/Spo0J family partition protein [Pirellulales bacterium]|nr:ParB/RepB/Spo0J family partition protein [Pirellulales bacterium]